MAKKPQASMTLETRVAELTGALAALTLESQTARRNVLVSVAALNCERGWLDVQQEIAGLLDSTAANRQWVEAIQQADQALARCRGLDI
jgi:hypothetical protein